MLDTGKLLRMLGVSERQMNELIGRLDDYYYLISNPKLNKKTGEQLLDKHGKPRTRDLYPSVLLLKKVQRSINRSLLKTIKLPEYAFGGVEKRDNILNAKMHQGNKFFFNTDLRNFYPGISHHQVFDMFVSNKFSPTIARILTKLTTYKGMLPQGTPTSPYLANLVFAKAGRQIQVLCESNHLTFTTFVDDITISSKTDFQPLINDIIDIIKDNGFKISHDKTFYQTKAPKVTNIHVMNNGLKLSKDYKKKIEAIDDKTSPQFKGMINYLNRVERLSDTPVTKVKAKMSGKSTK
jgi:RNA-directed DNA polymerase